MLPFHHFTPGSFNLEFKFSSFTDMVIQPAKLNARNDKHEKVDEKQKANGDVEPNCLRYPAFKNKKKIA